MNASTSVGDAYMRKKDKHFEQVHWTGGEHCSDVEISGDSFDVFAQPFDVWDAHG